ncbi:hypothetical protein DV736_g6352, partial [Chaetothyriales sp. CBS 134916]
MSSDDEFDYERENLKSNLFREISNVKSTGSFTTFGLIEDFVNPGISVEGQSPVRLPLSEVDAESLIRGSHRAPFGKGTETHIDESVRKTWEINASRIQFLNKRWKACVDRIATKAAGELGVAGGGAGANRIDAELHKMLIYEEGAMFKAHKDTEKTPGMFGTLIICLPSRHTGGRVGLQHGNKKEVVDTSDSSAFDASYIAWYDFNSQLIAPQLMIATGMLMSLTNDGLTITEDSLLGERLYDNREPDVQRGGGYQGNQHAEIDQFYKDSGPDLYLGSVAATAMFLGNGPLFSEVIGKTEVGFADYSYAALGEVFTPEDSAISKNDGKLHKTTNNVMNFHKGFSRVIPDRNVACQARQVKIWLDSIIYKTLRTVTEASIKDSDVPIEYSESIIRIILDHTDDPFSQLDVMTPLCPLHDGFKQCSLPANDDRSVIYQSVRHLVDWFSGKVDLLIPLAIRILHRLDLPTSPSNSYLRSLLNCLLQPVVTDFNVSIYSSSACKHFVGSLGYSPAGPIKALYTHFQAANPELSVTLLNRIQEGAGNLSPEKLLLSFVSLIFPRFSTTHALPPRTNRLDPHCRSTPQRLRCATCARINDILLDPHAPIISVAWYVNMSRTYLTMRFRYLEFSEEHAADASPTQSQDMVVDVTKTLKYWETTHASWKRQGESAIRSVQQLRPEEKLKECLLGNNDDVAARKQRYNDIMEFNLVKDKEVDKADDYDEGPSDTTT